MELGFGAHCLQHLGHHIIHAPGGHLPEGVVCGLHGIELEELRV